MKKNSLFEPGRYAALPYAVMGLAGLSSGAKLVWQALASHLGRDGSAVWPSASRLASMTGQNRTSVLRQIAELVGEPWRLIRVDRVIGRPSRYRMLQPQAGLFDGGRKARPVAKCDQSQNATGAKMRPVAKCAPNYSSSSCTDTDTVRRIKTNSFPKESDRKAPAKPSSASGSAKLEAGDRRPEADKLNRERAEQLERITLAIRLPRDLRTESRRQQFHVDCLAMERFLDEARAGGLGPPARTRQDLAAGEAWRPEEAVAALLAKAANIGRSTVSNRMAALTAWVKKRRAAGDEAVRPRQGEAVREARSRRRRTEPWRAAMG